MTTIMSLREPFERNGIWYYELDRKRLSLRTRDKQQAHRLFRAIQREYLSGKVLKITGDCSRTLGDFADEVYDLLQETAPENSWRAMKSTILRLYPVMGHSIRLDRLGPQHWDPYISACKPAKSTCKTIRTYQLQLRILMSKAVSWGLLPEDPWGKCKLAKEEIREPAFIQPAQVAPFLEGIEDEEVRRLAALCIFTGRRIGEVVLLEWQNFDFEALKYKAWIPKIQKWQRFPMHEVLLDVLLPIRKDLGRICPRWSSGGAAGPLLKRELRAAGFGNLRPHDLRHTFASLIILAGNDLKIAQELLGHASYKSTLRYAHLTPDALAAGLSRVQFAYTGATDPGITPSDK